jgi:hypothetical protein
MMRKFSDKRSMKRGAVFCICVVKHQDHSWSRYVMQLSSQIHAAAVLHWGIHPLVHKGLKANLYIAEKRTSLSSTLILTLIRRSCNPQRSLCSEGALPALHGARRQTAASCGRLSEPSTGRAHLDGFAWLHVEDTGQAAKISSQDTQELLLSYDVRYFCCRNVLRELLAGRRRRVVQSDTLHNTQQAMS